MWDVVFSKDINLFCDNWLESYLDKIDKNNIIYDIGCGDGNNTKWLIERWYRVCSVDFSKNALRFVKENINRNVEFADMTKKLPFEDNTISIIIADKSIHFFDFKTTKFILDEFKRILFAGGILILRINSITNIFSKKNLGIEIENHYYKTLKYEGNYDRYFDKDHINSFFSDFKNLQYIEKKPDNYKFAFEIFCRKKWFFILEFFRNLLN